MEIDRDREIEIARQAQRNTNRQTGRDKEGERNRQANE